VLSREEAEGISLGKPPSSSSSSFSSVQMLSQLRGQIHSLQGRWLAAKREAATCVLASVTLFPEEEDTITSQFLQKRGEGRQGLGFGLGGKSGTVSSERSSTGRSVASQHTQQHTAGAGTVLDAGELLLHRVLGVHPPLSLSTNLSCMNTSRKTSNGGKSQSKSDEKASGEVNKIEEREDITTTGLVLDLSRIHSLQSSLLDLIITTRQLCDSMSGEKREEKSSNEEQGNTDTTTENENQINSNIVWPISASSVHQKKQFHKLCMLASDLTLSLACLAPLSPLCTSEKALLSSSTGLQALMTEVKTLSTQIKQTSVTKLRRATERVTREQVSLAMELQRARRQSLQWIHAAHALLPKLEVFGTAAMNAVKTAVNDVKVLSETANTIMTEIHAAEAARVTCNTGVLINPLDALAKGAMGVEVASLILSVRMHMSDLAQGASRLRALHTSLETSLDRSMDMLSSTKIELRSAMISATDESAEK